MKKPAQPEASPEQMDTVSDFGAYKLGPSPEKPSAREPGSCRLCGKAENDSKHARYGNDLDNPVKHVFVPTPDPVQHGVGPNEIEEWFKKWLQAERDKGFRPPSDPSIAQGWMLRAVKSYASQFFAPLGPQSGNNWHKIADERAKEIVRLMAEQSKGQPQKSPFCEAHSAEECTSCPCCAAVAERIRAEKAEQSKSKNGSGCKREIVSREYLNDKLVNLGLECGHAVPPSTGQYVDCKLCAEQKGENNG